MPAMGEATRAHGSNSGSHGRLICTRAVPWMSMLSMTLATATPLTLPASSTSAFEGSKSNEPSAMFSSQLSGSEWGTNRHGALLGQRNRTEPDFFHGFEFRAVTVLIDAMSRFRHPIQAAELGTQPLELQDRACL